MMTMVRAGLMVLGAVAAIGAIPADSFAQKRQRDLLTSEEISTSAVKTADLHRAIRSLRPHFLTPARGVRTLGNSIQEPLAVYVNGARQTGEDALRTIQAESVEEVRYLDPNKAGNEFGPKASGGALVVKLRKQADREPAPPPPVPVTPPPPPPAA
jgi:hypothetical protein